MICHDASIPFYGMKRPGTYFSGYFSDAEARCQRRREKTLEAATHQWTECDDAARQCFCAGSRRGSARAPRPGAGCDAPTNARTTFRLHHGLLLCDETDVCAGSPRTRPAGFGDVPPRLGTNGEIRLAMFVGRISGRFQGAHLWDVSRLFLERLCARRAARRAGLETSNHHRAASRRPDPCGGRGRHGIRAGAGFLEPRAAARCGSKSPSRRTRKPFWRCPIVRTQRKSNWMAN